LNHLPLLLGSYVLGAIPTGYWLGLAWKGIDVRTQGSGNLGATNVFRVLGKGPGIVTLILDIWKGILPILAARHYFPDMPMLPLEAGLLAILGHTTSPFVGFRGGKGVATSAGVFYALLPIPTSIAVGVFSLSLFISAYVSLSSILAALTLAIATCIAHVAIPLKVAAVAIAVFVIWKHRTNIQRLRAGTESKIR
jgi:glycerol-3-phosphate acyltransferase PlsY